MDQFKILFNLLSGGTQKFDLNQILLQFDRPEFQNVKTSLQRIAAMYVSNGDRTDVIKKVLKKERELLILELNKILTKKDTMNYSDAQDFKLTLDKMINKQKA